MRQLELSTNFYMLRKTLSKPIRCEEPHCHGYSTPAIKSIMFQCTQIFNFPENHFLMICYLIMYNGHHLEAEMLHLSHKTSLRIIRDPCLHDPWFKGIRLQNKDKSSGRVWIAKHSAKASQDQISTKLSPIRSLEPSRWTARQKSLLSIVFSLIPFALLCRIPRTFQTATQERSRNSREK